MTQQDHGLSIPQITRRNGLFALKVLMKEKLDLNGSEMRANIINATKRELKMNTRLNSFFTSLPYDWLYMKMYPFSV